MTLLKSFAFMIFMVINSTSANTVQSNYSLHGTIIYKETGKPFAQAYVYTVKGEEETLTDHRGEFKFTSWQKLPVTLHVDYAGKYLRLLIKDPAKKIKIEL